MTASAPLIQKVAIIGLGLIGSSIARAMRESASAGHITACDESAKVRARVTDLAIADHVTNDYSDAVGDADLVLLCTPLGQFAPLAHEICPHLKPGAIVSDVGSVKAMVQDVFAPHLPVGVHLVPGHPVAGTEQSGPDAGYGDLFAGRWCILTPAQDTDPHAVATMTAFWQSLGSRVEVMEAKHHDLVLAITSHVPHLIAYNIVGTASDLDLKTKKS